MTVRPDGAAVRTLSSASSIPLGLIPGGKVHWADAIKTAIRLLGDITSVGAFELIDGSPGGYEFQTIGDVWQKRIQCSPMSNGQDQSRGAVSTVGRRERKQMAVREHLYASAWALFDAASYDEVTMEAIAAAADVARGTLYKYFPTKEAFIQERFYRDALARKAGTVRRCRAQRSTAGRLRALLLIDGAYAEDMRAYVGPYLYHRLAALRLNAASVEREIFETMVGEILEQGRAAGDIRDGIAVDALAESFVFLRVSMLVRWLGSGDRSIGAHLEQMLDLFLHGAANRTMDTPCPH